MAEIKTKEIKECLYLPNFSHLYQLLLDFLVYDPSNLVIYGFGGTTDTGLHRLSVVDSKLISEAEVRTKQLMGFIHLYQLLLDFLV